MMLEASRSMVWRVPCRSPHTLAGGTLSLRRAREYIETHSELRQAGAWKHNDACWLFFSEIGGWRMVMFQLSGFYSSLLTQGSSLLTDETP